MKKIRVWTYGALISLAVGLALIAPVRRALALDRLIEVLAVGVTDNRGVVLSSGTVTFYDAGTTNLRTVYSDFALGTPLANPAALDTAGRLIAYTNRRVKLLIKSATGSTVRTVDNVGTADSDIVGAISVSTLAGSGLTAPGDGSIAVNVDNATIDVSSDIVRVKPTADLSVASVTTSDGISAGTSVTVGPNGTNIDDNSGGTFVTAPLGRIYLTPASQTDRAYLQAHGPRWIDIGTYGTSTVYPIVTSPAPAAHALVIIRGHIDTSGNSPNAGTSLGEGWTGSKTGTGDVTATFSTACADTPIVTTGVGSANGFQVQLFSVSTSAVRFKIYQAASLTDAPMDFIAACQRGS